MNRCIFFVLILGLSFTCYSQFDYGCENYEQLLQEADPSYLSLKQQIFDRNNNVAIRSGQKLRVPVVIHNVWKEQSEYFTQQEIEDQIFVLNRDFNRQNADTSNLRSIFQPVAGNPNIEFVIAHIEWVETDSVFTPNYNFFGSKPLYFDAVKYTQWGGSDAWDPSIYMNVWIANLESGDPMTIVAGYSTTPAGAGASGDGIVIHWGTMPIGTSIPYGRALVHETGHYLGLLHIWGDDEDCASDDGFSDTPQQFGRNQHCDKSTNSCNQGVGDLPDMVENYMDYSYVTCQNSFTKQQVNMMRNVLQNERAAVASNPASIDRESLKVLNVYPNPFDDELTIRSSNEHLVIYLYDVSGKFILSKTINANSQLNLDFLESGSYLLHVLKDDKVVQNELLIKK